MFADGKAVRVVRDAKSLPNAKTPHLMIPARPKPLQSHAIEALEARIAPATFINSHLVQFTDVDGDTVKVKSSLPIFHKDLREFTFASNGIGEVLEELRLPTSAAGADIFVKVVSGAPGDGTVKVGAILAKGTDLRTVVVDGQLGRIWSGDANYSTAGLIALKVKGLGGGTEADPVQYSQIRGPAGVVHIDGDLAGGSLLVRWPLGRLVISGSIVGSASGAVSIVGALGALKVGEDLVGGSESGSGSVRASAFGTVQIGGSLIGGSGWSSGSLLIKNKQTIGSLNVAGDVIGGTGGGSGFIDAGKGAGAIHIGGSLIGGNSRDSVPSGGITGRLLGEVSVAGDVVGGEGAGSGSITGKVLGEVRIAGNVLGGEGAFSGAIKGTIIENLHIEGDYTGGSGSHSAMAWATKISTIRIDGNVSAGSIQATFDLNGRGPDSRIGSVRVGGDFIASSITAGVHPGADRQFGTDDDFVNTGLTTPWISRIASVVIGGRVLGTPEGGDSYAIQAQRIDSLKIGGVKMPLTAGRDTVQLAPETGDVLLRELK